MNSPLKSRLFAIALATAPTLVNLMAIPTAAQAGVLGSIKGAAKSVGGAVKSTAIGLGGAAKAGAAGVRQIGGTVVNHLPGVSGAKAAVKAVAQGKVKWR